jgi:hypothetical protein
VDISARVRLLSLLLISLILTTRLLGFGRAEKHTQREIDGFSGLVKTASTRVEKNPIKFKQPDGPSVVISFVACQECEYDKDGYRTREGSILGAGFQGHSTRYVRDASGAVIETIDENPGGEPTRRVLIGPFGPIEERLFAGGQWQTRQINHYDQRGNLTEWMTFDPEGRVAGNMMATFDENDMVTDQWFRGPNNSFGFHTVHTYDRKTKFETFMSFEEDGSVSVNWTMQDSKMLSYWQLPGAKSAVGSFFFMDTGPKTTEFWNYQSDGSSTHTVRTFYNEQKRNVSRTEFYDSANELRASADYEYEFDPFGNWLKRTTRVWTPELVQPQIYETDYRTLTYW